MDIGLAAKKDASFVAYLKRKGFQLSQQLKKDGMPNQVYLDYFYPQKERIDIKKMDISKKNLTGTLDCSDFVNLEELDCSSNKLTSLNLNNCLKLRTLNCYNNNFAEQDLSIFSHLVNLEELRIGNDKQEKIKQGIYNRFAGSL